MTVDANSIPEDEFSDEAHADADASTTGREENREWSDDDAEDAFLANLTGKKDEGEPGAEKPAEGDAEKPAATAETLAADDHLVEVKVGDETHRVPVSDLRRLFGQEAALTQKSQEVARARDEAKAAADHAKGFVTKALEKAQARFQPYADLDYFAASKRMDDASFAQLRKDAQEAHDEVRYLEEAAKSAAETSTRVDAQARQESAGRAVADLNDPKSPNHIEGWSDAVYGELMTFAEKAGLKSARTIIDASAIKMIQKAMLYDRGIELAKTKVKAAAEQPRRPMRSGTSGTASPTADRREDAVRRLARTGSADDAEAAFLSRMRRD